MCVSCVFDCLCVGLIVYVIRGAVSGDAVVCPMTSIIQIVGRSGP